MKYVFQLFQNHFLNVFDNIKNVEFHEKDYDKILSVISKEKESIKLDRFVMAQGNVEDWLNNLLKMSHHSVHTIIRQAFYAITDSSEFDIMDFLNNFPAQVSVWRS